MRAYTAPLAAITIAMVNLRIRHLPFHQSQSISRGILQKPFSTCNSRITRTPDIGVGFQTVLEDTGKWGKSYVSMSSIANC